jgi:hypothetical protein
VRPLVALARSSRAEDGKVVDMSHRKADPEQVVHTIMATTPAQLEAISSYSHDGFLLADAIAYTAQDERVEIRFQQEPLDPALPLPRREPVRESWWATEYRVPYLLCRLRVQHVLGRPTPIDAVEEESLLGIGWDTAAATLNVTTATREIRLRTRQLNAELLITATITSARRRRIGRLIPWDSTSAPI